MVGDEYNTLPFWHWTMQNELVMNCFGADGHDFASYQRLCVSNESEFAWNWPFLAIVMENGYMYTKYGWRWVRHFAILTLNNAKWTCHEMFWCPWRRFCELWTITCKQWERICINWPFLVIVIENWYTCTKCGWRWVQHFAILTLNNAKWTCHEVF